MEWEKEKQEAIKTLVSSEMIKLQNFHSPYEGYAMMKHSLEEAQDYIKALETKFDSFWRTIKTIKADVTSNEFAGYQVEYLNDTAILVIRELIQFVAMCEKFLESNKKWSEGAKENEP